jgi:Tfp pilus assembly protein PilO
MFRFLVPGILTAVAILVFLAFTNPAYTRVKALQVEESSFDTALTNFKKLQSERDDLSQRFNSIPESDLLRVKRIVPDSADNIRLIIELERMASPYSMVISDVEFEVDDIASDDESTTSNQLITTQADNPYETFELSFAVEGKYSDFISFLENVEESLRIVDVVEVSFSANEFSDFIDVNDIDVYKYTVAIQTYWLRN